MLKANQGWVFKNNDVIAKEVSTIEFELFSVRQVGGEVEFTPIVQHPLLDALDRFNEFTSAADGFYLTESHKNLAGDAFWFIDGEGINIRGIYLLQPDKVELELGEPTYGQVIIQAYKYKDTVDGKPVNETYDAETIVHHKHPNPNNAYRGKSKVEAAAEEIDTDNLATLASKRLYQRGLIVNFILATEKALTDEQVGSIEAQLRSKHGGANNAYRALVLSGGLEPKSIQLTNREMETIAQQKWFRDKIMSIFGNTPSSIGIVEDVNRANAEAGILHWKRTTIKAEMKAITDTINEFLVPRFGDNLLLGFKDPVPEDKATKITENVALVNASIITQNEAREDLGYDPSPDEGADEINRPVPEFNPLEIPRSVSNISYKQFLRRSGVYKKIEIYHKAKEVAKPVARKMVKSKKKEVEVPKPREHEAFTNEQVWKFHNKQIRVVEVHEEIFRQKVEAFIITLVEKALSQVDEEVARMQKKALFNEQDEILRATVDFTPILEQVGVLSAQQALQFVNDDDTVYNPFDLRKRVEKNVAKFAKSMVETDKNKIIDTIARGIAEGQSVPSIRNSLIQEFEEYSKSQAERITRTEVIRASNEGTLDAWKQSDVVTGKQWLTAEDDRVDEDCSDMNGVIVDLDTSYNGAIKDLFDEETASKLLDYGSVQEPPLHPNCRCTLLPVLIDSKSFDAGGYMREQDYKSKIKDLESQIDKRTKEFKEIREKNLDHQEYIKELEEYLE